MFKQATLVFYWMAWKTTTSFLWIWRNFLPSNGNVSVSVAHSACVYFIDFNLCTLERPKCTIHVLSFLISIKNILLIIRCLREVLLCLKTVAGRMNSLRPVTALLSRDNLTFVPLAHLLPPLCLLSLHLCHMCLCLSLCDGARCQSGNQHLVAGRLGRKTPPSSLWLILTFSLCLWHTHVCIHPSVLQWLPNYWSRLHFGS